MDDDSLIDIENLLRLQQMRVERDQKREEELSRARRRPVKLLSSMLTTFDCPVCAFTRFRGLRDLYISWDDQKKQFEVEVSMAYPRIIDPVSEENTLLYSEAVMQLPLIVADQSRCSCGSTLSLTNHSILRVNDDIQFEGTYVCKQCTVRKQTIIGNLLNGIARMWRDTTKVEVGPTGIKYEKKASDATGDQK